MGGPLFYGRQFLGIASNLIEHQHFSKRLYVYIRISSDLSFIQKFIGRFVAFDDFIHDPLL